MNLSKIDPGAALGLLAIFIEKDGPLQAGTDLKLFIDIMQKPKIDLLELAKSGELLPLIEAGARLLPIIAGVLKDRDESARLIDVLQSLAVA